MASDAESLQAELLRLRQFIKKFTPVMAKGTADGPLALHFSDYSVDNDDGPYRTVNTAYDRVFQSMKDGDAAKVIVGGPNGLLKVHSFFVHFAKVPGLPLDLVGLRLCQINDLAVKVYVLFQLHRLKLDTH